MRSQLRHSLDFALVAVGLLILVGSPFLGVLNLEFSELFNFSAENATAQVFWSLRVPRVVAGFLIGAVLSICGIVFQSLFHNPLASPFTLGVSSGASFGAAVSIVAGVSFSIAGVSSHALGALVGALITIGLIFLASRARLGLSGVSMLLVGVVINFFFGSLVIFLQYLADMAELFSLMRWMMGSLEIVGISTLLPLVVAVLFFVPTVVHYHQELNIIALGDELALARGVAVATVRRVLFVMCSVLIALTVTLAGPIGFVGIVIPHAVRLIYGPTHRGLLLRSFWVGGLFLVMCDTLGRVLIAPAEMPVGVITALVGAPLFVLILLRQRSGQLFR